ncbi:3,4-dioxygenase subunit beta [Pilimelia terevasa]|uniref:3,4-dioxygenase subunit beta n=1 Tax=Pilimelia terevasa TaxID=53372 RepID=A0A8J3BLP1_9ACTN|nr:3,4-dioxygenase subunit beta [Pilimelia terevasa]
MVDQGLAFDLATLAGRRQVLRALGLGALTLGLTACGGDTTAPGAAGSPAATSAGEIPDETAGPYPGDGSNGPDALNHSGIVRSDLRTSFGAAAGTAAGVPMTLELTLRDLAGGGGPFAGAAVYVWHCDREGRYSMYSAGVTDQNYLRGVQLSDAQGRVRFTSIFPACYAGRWPHVHFEVYPDRASITDAGKAVATSQLALPEAACRQVYGRSGYGASVPNLAGITLGGDTVFGDDGARSQLAAVTGDPAAGYTVALAVGVDTRTAPRGGQPAHDGQTPGGGPPRGTPSGGSSGRAPGPPPGGTPGAPPPGAPGLLPRPGGARPGGAPPATP